MISGTPRGFQDILPDEALVRERIFDTVRAVFSDANYLPVETPLMEDLAVLRDVAKIQESPFRLFDSDGRLLVLRPDNTLPVARLAATRMALDNAPVRLRYYAPVVRERQSLRGQPRQFTQLGVELMGGESCASEVEVLELLARALAALKIDKFQIVCGSVAPLNSLLDVCALSDDMREQIQIAVHNSDLVALDSCIAQAALPQEQAEALSRLVRLHGGAEVLDELDGLLASAGVANPQKTTQELKDVVAGLNTTIAGPALSFDFSIINSFSYYTGIIFKAYAPNVAAALGSGGRYDSVLHNFGVNNACACGFALSVERLQEALGENGESGVVRSKVATCERPLRIAIPKGSLLADTISTLQDAGLNVDELRNCGRRLIVATQDVEFIIVRAQDAPAFVANGGADCGFCGSDSLIEAGLDLITLVDCDYGACRFIVAEPRGRAGMAEASYAWRGSMRVATKYPRITQNYYDRIGQQVEILALHGNIELGPIVGMADRIVDITATGATLEENDLVVVDDVMECTARFFASSTAWRLDARVRHLSDAIARAVSNRKAVHESSQHE